VTRRSRLRIGEDGLMQLALKGSPAAPEPDLSEEPLGYPFTVLGLAQIDGLHPWLAKRAGAEPNEQPWAHESALVASLREELKGPGNPGLTRVFCGGRYWDRTSAVEKRSTARSPFDPARERCRR
jgi:hypothetical protein